MPMTVPRKPIMGAAPDAGQDAEALPAGIPSSLPAFSMLTFDVLQGLPMG